MKFFTSVTLACVVVLGGCASTNQTEASATEDSYTPIGTNIPRKSVDAADMAIVVDKQSLENARSVGVTDRAGQR